MSGKPIVWIVCPIEHDFSAAADFGQLTKIVDRSYDRHELTEMKTAMQSALAISSPEDIILITGPKVMNAVACSIFCFKHARLNLLLYTRSGYKLRKVRL